MSAYNHSPAKIKQKSYMHIKPW